MLITLAETGGAQTYIANLLPGLVDEFDVVLAAHGPGPLHDAARENGVRFASLRHLRRAISPWHDVLAVVELARLCRRERFDLVHANSSKAGVLGRIAAAVAGVPVRIFTVHGWAFAAYRGLASRVYLWADRLVRPLTSVIVCVADHERKIGVDAGTCDPDHTVVIHNAVDVGSFAVSTHDAAVPTLISVGRFSYPKDFATLVDALARLAAPHRALLVGDGPCRASIAADTRRRGIDVTFAGGRVDVPALLAAADVFVLSSRSEGLPLSVLEAMAAALPVVATRVGGIPEVVVDGETGILVDAGDAAGLAAALERLLADAELRARLGRAGRRRAEKEFDLPRFQAAHVAVYRRELARRGLDGISA